MTPSQVERAAELLVDRATLRELLDPEHDRATFLRDIELHSWAREAGRFFAQADFDVWLRGRLLVVKALIEKELTALGVEL